MSLYPGCDCTATAAGCSACSSEVIGGWLRHQRSRAGLTLSAAARGAHVTTGRLRALELGRGDLGVAELASLVRLYGSTSRATMALVRSLAT